MPDEASACRTFLSFAERWLVKAAAPLNVPAFRRIFVACVVAGCFGNGQIQTVMCSIIVLLRNKEINFQRNDPRPLSCQK